ncbi:hypothetical protein H4R19_005293 [Coemansia spiralis]|nr:hypothetical protein H4R19_005293 [Coemansia spiralis]
MKLLSLGCLVASAAVLLAESHAYPVERLAVVQQLGQYAVGAVGKAVGRTQAKPVAQVAPSQPNRMLCLVNRERGKKGLPPLELHPALMEAALEHSRYQAKAMKMTHANPEYGPVGARMSRNGFKMKSAAENIASVPGGTPEQLFALWCSEPLHYNNMMDPSASYMGLANINGYWTQDLGSSLDKNEKSSYAAVELTC